MTRVITGTLTAIFSPVLDEATPSKAREPKLAQKGYMKLTPLLGFFFTVEETYVSCLVSFYLSVLAIDKTQLMPQ